ncbi:hypothetical protein [Ferdinandcohnia sp. Marseille-Q9671]
MANKNILLLLMVLLFALTACSDNNETSSPNQKETKNEDSSREDSKTVVSDDSGTAVLTIGETGLIESTIGNYEVTPESVIFINSIEGKTSSYGTLIEATIHFKNVSDKAIETSSILYGDGRIIPLSDEEVYAIAVHITDEVQEIQPNETVTMKIVYDALEDKNYHLAFGDGLTSNEVRWSIENK